MGKIKVKNLPRLKLVDLLKRRKMTMRRLLDEYGITTYESLLERCNRMGVSPPTQEEFMVHIPAIRVTSAPEGVLILEPPPIIDEMTGEQIDPNETPKNIIILTEPMQIVDHIQFALGEPLQLQVQSTDINCSFKRVKKKKDSV